jgi:ABC-type phosphate/phosphonate transport system permease subunit
MGNTIIYKAICGVAGFFSGSTFAFVINWPHLIERTFETMVVSFFGGLSGTIAGLLVYFLIKKYNLGKYFHKNG